MGLVPKDQGKDVKLIFHLSYQDRRQLSVNANMPDELCKVTYTDFDQAVFIALQYLQDGETIYFSKSDIKSAFRVLGLNPESWKWLVLKAVSPLDNDLYYFIDKCLPFGSSISCALFQEVSDALAAIVHFRTQKSLINYLNDYLFIAALKSACNWQMNIFIHICKEIRMPLSEEKTVKATPHLTFLGFLLDGENHLVLVPLEKIN